MLLSRMGLFLFETAGRKLLDVPESLRHAVMAEHHNGRFGDILVLTRLQKQSSVGIIGLHSEKMSDLFVTVAQSASKRRK